MGQENAAILATANKRIGNILRKSSESFSKTIDIDLLLLDEERLLFEEVSKIDEQISPLLEQGDYVASLRLLSSLRAPVDAFFDAVMVMDEDPALRVNRLSLLSRLKALFDRVADLSVLG
jgi:glycyl-tRNA synthetase beta chain